jgi:hypothetical protein
MSRPAPLVLSEDHPLLPEDHPRCFAIASILHGRELAQLDGKAERRSRKLRVLERRLAGLRHLAADGSTLRDLAALTLEAAFTEGQTATLAVDLAFGNPFAPYELHYSERDFVESLHRSTEVPLVPLRAALVDRVLALKREAMGAHTPLFASRWRLALAGISSAAVLTLIPAFVGAAAGAAIVSQRVALVRAGVALGNVPLAGGGWLVAGVKSAASSSARAGARKLVNVAPAAAIRVEVAKWQTWAALRMGDGAWSRDDVAAQLERLDELEKDIERDLADERTLNDPGASRVRDLETKARAIATGRDWIAQRSKKDARGAPAEPSATRTNPP